MASLKAPSSELFSPDEWKEAFKAHGVDSYDQKLLNAALWIGAEVAAARKKFGRDHLSTLSSEWSTILAVAALNREYRTAAELAFEKASDAVVDGMLSMDVAANLRVSGAGGQRVTAANISQNSTDIAENWLFDAVSANGGPTPPTDLAPIAVNALQSYSFRKTMNTLWNLVWWDDWSCSDIEDNITIWKPGDLEFERLEVAWRMRQEANLMNLPFIDMTVWPKMTPEQRRRVSRPRGVTGVRGIGARQRFKVQHLAYLSRRMPVYSMEKAALEGTHLTDFTGAELPLLPQVTADLLLLAWHIIVDVATLLAKQAPLPNGSISPEATHNLALIVNRASLLQAIEDGLRINSATADAIVAFLTFNFQTGGKKKAAGNKGLWAAPLVEIPGTSQLALVQSVLMTSNIVRRVESWLEKGGLDDRRVTTWPATKSRTILDKPVPPTTESRGDRYETIVRSRISQAIARNRLFVGAACADREIKKTTTFPEQIDLLVSFGGLCLVGEVKFFLMPADPHERNRYDEKLRGAAQQAKAKVAALRAKPDALATALGIDLDSAKNLQLLPIIATAQGYRFSSRVEGVLVIDANFLRLYLGANEINTGMALEVGSGRNVKQKMTLYASEKEAADKFEQMMEKPYQVTRFLDQVTWEDTPIPTFAHHGAMMIVPAVSGDNNTFEMMQARAAADLLRQS